MKEKTEIGYNSKRIKIFKKGIDKDAYDRYNQSINQSDRLGSIDFNKVLLNRSVGYTRAICVATESVVA